MAQQAKDEFIWVRLSWNVRARDVRHSKDELISEEFHVFGGTGTETWNLLLVPPGARNSPYVGLFLLYRGDEPTDTIFQLVLLNKCQADSVGRYYRNADFEGKMDRKGSYDFILADKLLDPCSGFVMDGKITVVLQLPTVRDDFEEMIGETGDLNKWKALPPPPVVEISDDDVVEISDDEIVEISDDEVSDTSEDSVVELLDSSDEDEVAKVPARKPCQVVDTATGRTTPSCTSAGRPQGSAGFRAGQRTRPTSLHSQLPAGKLGLPFSHAKQIHADGRHRVETQVETLSECSVYTKKPTIQLSPPQRRVEQAFAPSRPAYFDSALPVPKGATLQPRPTRQAFVPVRPYYDDSAALTLKAASQQPRCVPPTRPMMPPVQQLPPAAGKSPQYIDLLGQTPPRCPPAQPPAPGRPRFFDTTQLIPTPANPYREPVPAISSRPGQLSNVRYCQATVESNLMKLARR